MAGWGAGKAWVATLKARVSMGKGERGTGSWDIREEILRNTGTVSGGRKKGRYSSSQGGRGEGLIRMAHGVDDGDGAEQGGRRESPFYC